MKSPPSYNAYAGADSGAAFRHAYGPLPIHVTEHARTKSSPGVIRRSSGLSASSASASPYCITGHWAQLKAMIEA